MAELIDNYYQIISFSSTNVTPVKIFQPRKKYKIKLLANKIILNKIIFSLVLWLPFLVGEISIAPNS